MWGAGTPSTTPFSGPLETGKLCAGGAAAPFRRGPWSLPAPERPPRLRRLSLEPLEEGKLVRGGSASRIAPSLWIFAGTEEPTASSASDKGQDLEQRLSGPVFHFREASQTRESDITKTERVYVGVSCLLQRFPEVNRVSPQVLQAFWMMTGAVPREVRRFVWDFDDVQYSRVMGHNLPRDHQRKYPHLNSNQRRADDENLLVEIKRRPAE